MVCWRLLGCWRMVWPAVVDGWRLMLQAGGCWPFWGPERQGGRAAPPGRWSAGDVWGGQCSGGNSAVFNQPLTIFLVVAMVWRLAVSFLCSYQQFRRCWRLFRSPGAGRCRAVSGVVWGGWLLDQGMGGVAEKGTVLLRMGVEYCPTSSTPIHGLWGWRKTGRGSFCNPGQKSSEPHAGLSKISSFY